MSAFSIHQAHQEWPTASTAYRYDIPPHTGDTKGEAYLADNEEVLQPYPYHRHTRSRSETDLLAMIDKEPTLTPLPPRPSSLRRLRRTDPLLHTTLLSYRLGDPSPTNLPHMSTGPYLPDVHLQGASEDANHSHADLRSLLLSSMSQRPPLSPPQSPETSTFNTPRPGAFPLPPKGPPFRDPFDQNATPRSFSNRQYTVIDGEVSPSRLGDHDEGTDYFGSPPSPHDQTASTASEKSNPSSTSSKKFRDKALPVPPRTSSLSRRRPGQLISRPMSGIPETPLSLALSLFDISKLPPPPDAPESDQGAHIITPKRDLTVNDVNIVLGDIVDVEKLRIKSRGKRWDDAARCRVGWLMDQVGDLVRCPPHSTEYQASELI